MGKKTNRLWSQLAVSIKRVEWVLVILNSETVFAVLSTFKKCPLLSFGSFRDILLRIPMRLFSFKKVGKEKRRFSLPSGPGSRGPLVANVGAAAAPADLVCGPGVKERLEGADREGETGRKGRRKE